MKKKNATQTSKKKKFTKPITVKLNNGQFVDEEYSQQFMSIHDYDKPKQDTEKMPAPKDAASKLKYPPPRKDPVFRKHWTDLIDLLPKKPSIAQLKTLEVLCQLYIDYDNLTEFLRVNGRAFKVVTRFSTFRKPHPEVAQLEKVRNGIRGYTAKLNLFPKVEKGAGMLPDPETKDEWT